MGTGEIGWIAIPRFISIPLTESFQRNLDQRTYCNSPPIRTVTITCWNICHLRMNKLRFRSFVPEAGMKDRAKKSHPSETVACNYLSLPLIADSDTTLVYPATIQVNLARRTLHGLWFTCNFWFVLIQRAVLLLDKTITHVSIATGLTRRPKNTRTKYCQQNQRSRYHVRWFIFFWMI